MQIRNLTASVTNGSNVVGISGADVSDLATPAHLVLQGFAFVIQSSTADSVTLTESITALQNGDYPAVIHQDFIGQFPLMQENDLETVSLYNQAVRLMFQMFGSLPEPGTIVVENGDYQTLRARGTTKGDVELPDVDNYSRAHYDNRYGLQGTEGGQHRTNSQNDERFAQPGTTEDRHRTNSQNDERFAQKAGDYSGLRARATTKGDVGLTKLNDFPISHDPQSASEEEYASAKAVRDGVRAAVPISMTYVQFPGRSAPATIFGGSWVAVFDDEGVFFRTPGGDAAGFGSGIQSDQMQLTTGRLGNSQNFGIFFKNWTGTGALRVGAGSDYRISDVASSAPGNGGFLQFNSGNSPGARTSPTTDGETRPINRTIRVWEKIGH